MKKLFGLFGAFLVTVAASPVVYGKQVGQDVAKAIGTNFLVTVGAPGVQSASDLVPAYTASSMVNGQSVVEYYVFNIVGRTGFVMVSGDDNVIPVLAHSTEASFDYDKISPAAKDWIKGYQDQIAAVIKYDLPASQSTVAEWEGLQQARPRTAARTTAVSALLTTKWDQAPGYNSQCPGGSVTGCVATAMAQVMKYWNWPSVGCGRHTYTPASYAAQTVNFGTTAYNWTSMPNTSSNSNIARLMYHAGVSVDMMYSPSVSGAYTMRYKSPVINNAEYALETYFHYKRSLRGVLRDDSYFGGKAISGMTESAWIAMLRAELDANRPMIYSGSSSTGSGGHAWVCDGWQVTGSQFHFNWGWSGSGPDGYYTVNNLAPPSLGTGGGGGNFNSYQAVIIGIQPDSFPNTAGNIRMQTFLSTTTSSPMDFGGGVSVSTKIKNAGTTTFNGDFCAQAFDTSNNLIATIQTLTGKTIAAGDSTATLTFAAAAMNSLVCGTYSIRIMYRTSSSAPWVAVANNGTFVNYGLIDVRNNDDMSLYDFMITTPGTTVGRGNAFTVKARINNGTSGVFNGTVRAVLVNATDGSRYVVQEFGSQIIYYGNSTLYTFTNPSITAPIGNYALEIEHQYGGAGASITTGSLYYPNPIAVKVVSAIGIQDMDAIESRISVYPNPASETVHISLDGLPAGSVRIVDLQGREVYKTSPDATIMVLDIPVHSFAAGIYFAQIETEAGVVTKKIVVAK